MRLQRGADLLGGARDLDRAGDGGAQRADRLPLRRERRDRAIPAGSSGTARDAPSARRRSRRAQASSAVKTRIGASQIVTARKDLLDRLERAEPLHARRRLAIERVLADVEIEGREVGVHERRKRARRRAHSRNRRRLARTSTSSSASLCSISRSSGCMRAKADRVAPARSGRACRASSAACCAACGNCR